jgi:uncharacterized protein (TIGR03089 family)
VPPAATLTSLRRDRLAAAGASPLLTAYDERTGERTELSHTTFDGWVSKTANLLRDGLGLGHAAVVAVDLPPHWLLPVWLGACAEVGAVVALGGDPGSGDLAVCGPDGIEAALAAPEVMACSLLPFAMPFRSPLPPGADDYCLEVRAYGDRFAPSRRPDPSDEVLAAAAGPPLDHAGVLADASSLAAGLALGPGARALVAAGTTTSDLVALLLAVPLLLGGSTVLVVGTDDEGRLDLIATQEGAKRVSLR